MRRTRLIVLPLALGLSFAAALPARTSAIQAAEGDPLTVKARALLAAMEKADFQGAILDFDETMLKVFGPDKVEAMWTKQLPAQVGAFKQQGPARQECRYPGQ